MSSMLVLADSNFMRFKDVVIGRQATSVAAVRAATLVDVKRYLAAPDLNFYVIASVNMLVDEVLVFEDSLEEKQRKARIRIDEIFAFANRTATEKAVKIVIVPPLLIQNPPKYAQISQQVLQFFLECYAAQAQSFDVTKEFTQVTLGQDRLHLTSEAGKEYAQHVLSESCRLFGFVTGMDEDRPSWADDTPAADGRILDEISDETIKRAITFVFQRHLALRKEVEERWASDDRAWCLSEEARDAAANETKLDTLVFIGTSYNFSGTEDPAAMYQSCTDLIATVVDPMQCQQVCGSGMVHIIKVIHLNKTPGARPILEVKLDSRATAAMVRRCFLTKVREMPMPGVTIAPAVTAGTRVRIEVMKAIAKRMKAAGQDAFCVQHVPKPIMAVIESGYRTNYSYIEAVTRFGGMVSQSDLEPAYKRLLGSFPGRAKPMFLILSEAGRAPYQPTSKKRSYRVMSGMSGSGQPRAQRPRLSQAPVNNVAHPPKFFFPQHPNPMVRPQNASQAQWRVPPPSTGPMTASASSTPTVPMPSGQGFGSQTQHHSFAQAVLMGQHQNLATQAAPPAVSQPPQSFVGHAQAHPPAVSQPPQSFVGHVQAHQALAQSGHDAHYSGPTTSSQNPSQ